MSASRISEQKLTESFTTKNESASNEQKGRLTTPTGKRGREATKIQVHQHKMIGSKKDLLIAFKLN